jgi:hypothetical protein
MVARVRCGVAHTKTYLRGFRRRRLAGMVAKICHHFSVHLLNLGEIATGHIDEVLWLFSLAFGLDIFSYED